MVYSALPTLPTPLWRALAREAGVHLFVAADAVVGVAGSTLVVRCTGEHWRPHTQAHVRLARPAAGSEPPREDGRCVVKLPRQVARVSTSAGVAVCALCDEWTMPVNTTEAFLLE